MTEQTEKETPKSGQGTQWFQGEWIYVSGFIGIISLLVGVIIFLGHFITSTYYLVISLVIIIIIALSAFYTYMRKMPSVFILKVSAVAIVVSFIFLVVITAAGFALYMLPRLSTEPTLMLEKLDYETEYYVEITPEELKELPPLQSMINQSKSRPNETVNMETTRDEKNRIFDLISQKEAELFYPFEMWVFVYPEAYNRDEIPDFLTPISIEMTTENLERFPSIKRAFDQSKRRCGFWCGNEISADEWDSFLEFTQGNDDYATIYFISGDKLYGVSKTENIRSDFKHFDSSIIKVEGEYYQFRVAPVG